MNTNVCKEVEARQLNSDNSGIFGNKGILSEDRNEPYLLEMLDESTGPNFRQLYMGC